MPCLCDSSVLIAAILPGHTHHEPSRQFVKKIVAGQSKGLLALHTLAEFYSVVTRIPLDVQIDPQNARRLVKEILIEHFSLVEPSAKDYESAMDRVVEQNLRGGAIHDALILQTALKKKTTHLVTWNLKHFERLSRGEIKIVTPEAFLSIDHQ